MDTPGLMLACKDRHINTVKMVFEYIQTFLHREELNADLQEKLLKILFYTHDEQDTMLQVCLKNKQTDILKEILTWPEQLELNAEEKIIVCNWFSFINRDGQTILQYTVISKDYYAINLLQRFQENLDQNIQNSKFKIQNSKFKIQNSKIRKRTHFLPVDSTLLPNNKKEVLHKTTDSNQVEN